MNKMPMPDPMEPDMSSMAMSLSFKTAIDNFLFESWTGKSGVAYAGWICLIIALSFLTEFLNYSKAVRSGLQKQKMKDEAKKNAAEAAV